MSSTRRTVTRTVLPTIYTSSTCPTPPPQPVQASIHPAAIPIAVETVCTTQPIQQACACPVPSKRSTSPVRMASPRPVSPTRILTPRIAAAPIIEEEEIAEDINTGEYVEVEAAALGVQSPNTAQSCTPPPTQNDCSSQYENEITDIEAQETKNYFPQETRITVSSQVKTIRQTGIQAQIMNMFGSPGFSLRVYSVETKMTSMQSSRYDADLQALSGTKNSYGLYVPVTDFLYPKNVYDPSLPVDNIVANGGWVNRDTVVALGNYSPKLQFLIQFLKQRMNRRHVVHCLYLERYGVDLIVALLRASGINMLVATQDFRDPAGRSYSNKSSQHLEAIRTFNTTNNFSILITNMKLFDAGIFDIDYLHFVDPVDFGIFAGITNKIFHLQYYMIAKNINHYFPCFTEKRRYF